MTSRRAAWLRIASSIPLLLLALLGKAKLQIDVENLAMKSRGTAEERVAEDLAAQFDPAPRIFLLATAIAPALLEAIDDQAVDAWIQALRDSPATRSVDRLPTPEVSQVCLAVVPVLDELGRYAASCDSIVALARAE